MRTGWAFPGILWCCVFLIFNLTNLKGGGTNPDSRYAVMASLFDGHTLSIDRYVDWSDDWAKAPSGHYYSNKAPGPALVAAPVMMGLDALRVSLFGKESYETSPSGEVRLKHPSLAVKTFICLIFQLLPFCLLTLLGLELLKKLGASVEARTYAALALLFGNTASLFMNSFFGHAFAACALLAMLLALERKNSGWVGFFFGLAFLSDYGGIFLLPALAAAVWVRGPSETGWGRSLFRLAAGGLLPAVVWVGYHTLCFGSPWALPFQYDNPRWLVRSSGEHSLWGMAALVPDVSILLKLLFSPERGILFTQPWIFPVLALVLFSGMARELRTWLVFGFVGLAGLLWMNASFGAWHAGGSPGPRYLSMIFPVLALPSGLVLERVRKNSWLRGLLWGTLAVAVVFFAFAYCGDLSAPHDIPLWRFYWNTLWDGWYRVHLLTLAFVSAILIWALRRSLGAYETDSQLR